VKVSSQFWQDSRFMSSPFIRFELIVGHLIMLSTSSWWVYL